MARGNVKIYQRETPEISETVEILSADPNNIIKENKLLSLDELELQMTKIALDPTNDMGKMMANNIKMNCLSLLFNAKIKRRSEDREDKKLEITSGTNQTIEDTSVIDAQIVEVMRLEDGKDSND